MNEHLQVLYKELPFPVEEVELQNLIAKPSLRKKFRSRLREFYKMKVTDKEEILKFLKANKTNDVYRLLQNTQQKE